MSNDTVAEARSVAERLERLIELADRHLPQQPKVEEESRREVASVDYPTHADPDLESELYLLKTENDLLKQKCKKEGRVATLTEEMGELVRMQAATISRLENELKMTRDECRQLKHRLQGKYKKGKENSVITENSTPRKKAHSGVSSLIEKYSPGEGATPPRVSLSHRGSGFGVTKEMTDDTPN